MKKVALFVYTIHVEVKFQRLWENILHPMCLKVIQLEPKQNHILMQMRFD